MLPSAVNLCLAQANASDRGPEVSRHFRADRRLASGEETSGEEQQQGWVHRDLSDLCPLGAPIGPWGRGPAGLSLGGRDPTTVTLQSNENKGRERGLDRQAGQHGGYPTIFR